MNGIAQAEACGYKNDEPRSVWLAYGYTDPVVWEQRQGVDQDYNRGFQSFRGDTFLWPPEEADARAARAEGVAEGDAAAVHVHALGVEAEVADYREGLDREGFVQLDQVEVLGLEA